MPRQTQFNLPQLSLGRLLNMTPREYYSRKAKCRIAAQQYGAGSRQGFQRSRPKYPIYYNEMRTAVVCPAGNRRWSYVRFYGPPEGKTPVWVWCSCEDFAYRLEWVMAQVGCSSIATGYAGQGVAIINKPPDVRNPQRKPGLCKHLLMASDLALRQTRDYASEMGKKEAAVQPANRTASMRSYLPGRITTDFR